MKTRGKARDTKRVEDEVEGTGTPREASPERESIQNGTNGTAANGF